jgi:hypothetical protein
MYPITLDIESVGIPDCETYLEPCKAPDNYKDPQKIEAYIREAREKQVEKAALDVDLGRVIALGINRPGYPTEVWTTERRTEADLLEQFWDIWRTHSGKGGRMVTYAGLHFDLPFLLRRSLYLCVPAPYLQLDKYRHPDVIDVQAILSMDGKLTWRSLSFFLNRFGYDGLEPDITGAEIAKAYAEGDWPAIERHCCLDVDGTKWLAERIGAIPKLQPLGVPALEQAF